MRHSWEQIFKMLQKRTLSIHKERSVSFKQINLFLKLSLPTV